MNYVIGSGITGLICGYILGWPVIGKNLGGQLNSPFPLGPRILETCSDNLWLLEKLKLNPGPPKSFHVGYLLPNGKISGTPAPNFKRDYYYKTRGEVDDIPEDVMSGGRNMLSGWDLRDVRIDSVLESKVIRYHNDVVMIDPEEKTLTLDNVFIVRYNNLINTIPLPKLGELLSMDLSKEYDLRSRTVLFERRPVYPSAYVITGFDYVYVSDPHILFHRITSISEGYCVFEFIERPGLSYNTHSKNSMRLEGVQIVRNLDLRNKLGIELIGRYAQWTHDFKIEHSIRRARQYAKQVGAV